jgi:poly-gamma-glutamate synthesis protein (capsule biosynthesis protein)
VRHWLSAGAAALWVSIALAGAAAGQAGGRDGEDMVIAVGGDMIGPYKSFATVDNPEFQEIRRIISQSDAAFANQEGAVFDLAEFTGWPAAENGGGTPLTPRKVSAEVRQLGVRLVSLANNHATDWGTEGLLLTRRALDEIGIVHAGSGLNEATASDPAYLETPRGTIGLVATASTFLKTSTPSDETRDRRGRLLRARPGISVLRADMAMRANAEEIAALDAMALRRGEKAAGNRVRIGSQAFVKANGLGASYSVNEGDRTRLVRAVRTAADRSRLAIFTIHAHETAVARGTGGAGAVPPGEFPVPADFLPPLFHEAIDAGADLVVRHGPHVLNGIEIYKGRPIFYSLGSLFFDFDGERSYAPPGSAVAVRFGDQWFESAVATVRYRGQRAVEIKLYPVMIEVSKQPSGGLPMRARGEDARRILGRIRQMSLPYGTRVEIEGDIGTIRIAAQDQ